MKAEVGILAVKASWIIYFAMLLSSCSEIRINQIADWMEKQEEVKFFFNIVKDNHIQLNSTFTIPLMNTLYCVQLLWFLQQGKSVLFFVTTDACAVNWKWYIDLKFITNELNQRHSVVPWGTLNVWAEIFYCWWKGFENCSSAMKCASNYLFIFPQLTLLDFPLFLLHLLWVWHNVILFNLFIYFLPQDFKWTVFLKNV